MKSTLSCVAHAELMMRVQPDMEVWSKHSPEAITLQRLDWSNLRVVAAVLGQSVALDYYARRVHSVTPTCSSFPLVCPAHLTRSVHEHHLRCHCSGFDWL